MSKTFNATIKKTHEFQASVASILVHLDSSYESIPNGGVPYSALVKNSIADKDVKWQTVPLMVTNNEMLNALTDGGFVDLQLVMPEDDSGYQLGHVYQFRIINDVYSWEDVTPSGGESRAFSLKLENWEGISGHAMILNSGYGKASEMAYNVFPYAYHLNEIGYDWNGSMLMTGTGPLLPSSVVAGTDYVRLTFGNFVIQINDDGFVFCVSASDPDENVSLILETVIEFPDSEYGYYYIRLPDIDNRNNTIITYNSTHIIGCAYDNNANDGLTFFTNYPITDPILVDIVVIPSKETGNILLHNTYYEGVQNLKQYTDSQAGSIQQIDLTGTLESGVITFVPDTTFETKNNTLYKFVLTFSAVARPSFDAEMAINLDGTNTVPIVNIFNKSAATNTTVQQMKEVEEYNLDTGFKWVFVGIYNEVDNNGTITRAVTIPASLSNPQGFIMCLTNVEMLAVVTAGGLLDGQIVLATDDDGYAIGHYFKWNSTNSSFTDLTPTPTPQDIPTSLPQSYVKKSLSLDVTNWVSSSLTLNLTRQFEYNGTTYTGSSDDRGEYYTQVMSSVANNFTAGDTIALTLDGTRLTGTLTVYGTVLRCSWNRIVLFIGSASYSSPGGGTACLYDTSLISVYNSSRPTSATIENSTTAIQHSKIISDTDILVNSEVSYKLDKTNGLLAGANGLQTAIAKTAGQLVFTTKTVPTTAITGTLCIAQTSTEGTATVDGIVYEQELPDPYTLPIATASTLGGVTAVTKTDEVGEVAVDANGKLWVSETETAVIINKDVEEQNLTAAEFAQLKAAIDAGKQAIVKWSVNQDGFNQATVVTLSAYFYLDAPDEYGLDQTILIGLSYQPPFSEVTGDTHYKLQFVTIDNSGVVTTSGVFPRTNIVEYSDDNSGDDLSIFDGGVYEFNNFLGNINVSGTDTIYIKVKGVLGGIVLPTNAEHRTITIIAPFYIGDQPTDTSALKAGSIIGSYHYGVTEETL